MSSIRPFMSHLVEIDHPGMVGHLKALIFIKKVVEILLDISPISHSIQAIT